MKKKAPFKKFEPRQEKSERKGIQCFECGGIEHIASDCGNLKNKKEGKVMAATLSGSDDFDERDESSDDEDEVPSAIPTTLRNLPTYFPNLPPKHTYLQTPVGHQTILI